MPTNFSQLPSNPSGTPRERLQTLDEEESWSVDRRAALGSFCLDPKHVVHGPCQREMGITAMCYVRMC